MSIPAGHVQPVSRPRQNSRVSEAAQREAAAEPIHAVIHSRRSVSARRLVEPGPSEEQLLRMFHAAAAAPDHGILTPWRFVVVPREKRKALGEAFALALIGRAPTVTLEQIEDAREKADRSPFLMLCIARLGTLEPNVPTTERLVSMGCAIQNILLCAEASGFGAGLASGRALQSEQIRALFALSEGEEAVCFVNIGTVSKRKPGRVRPAPQQFVSTLAGASDVKSLGGPTTNPKRSSPASGLNCGEHLHV